LPVICGDRAGFDERPASSAPIVDGAPLWSSSGGGEDEIIEDRLYGRR
jgi:hypothetical protein